MQGEWNSCFIYVHYDIPAFPKASVLKVLKIICLPNACVYACMCVHE